jgi:hypothetical protein
MRYRRHSPTAAPAGLNLVQVQEACHPTKQLEWSRQGCGLACMQQAQHVAQHVQGSSFCRLSREHILAIQRASLHVCVQTCLRKAGASVKAAIFLSWLNSSTSCAYRSFPAGAASCCSSSSEAAHTAAATLSLLTWRPTCPLNFDFHRQAVMSKRIHTSLCIQCCSRSVTCCSTIFLVNMTTRATVSIAYPDRTW